jgi:hypothetical protein
MVTCKKPSKKIRDKFGYFTECFEDVLIGV